MNKCIINQIIERLDELEEDIREDKEYDLLAMFLQARDNFVKFINAFYFTDKPSLGVTNDGRITGEWRDKNDKQKVIAIVICDDKGYEYIVR